ncbi:MAG: riboflavin biosynthesis protein RibD [Candidatus Margulisbacteria bacterium GWF2_35_9]|nr:MAG: riboflavin biosynthesis protein RibD [Candidatus Margulisbacteria bacterium GWF2_35_9]
MTFSKQEKKYMKKALALAGKGLGKVSPNPMVGAIVVKNDKIVGRGYHKSYGKPHAEVNALADAGDNAKGATIYVSLEPCNHYGKTPPCTEQIIKAGITKVVYAIDDPNPIMNECTGRQALEQAGIEVVSGLLENEAKRINEKFLKYIQTKRPYITLKMASTINGKIADRVGHSKWISNSKSREKVQFLRYSHDAIMVGIGTVLMDNPSLTVRYQDKKKDITKIIMDKNVDIPINAKLFESKDKVIIVSNRKLMNSQKVKELQKNGTDFIFSDVSAGIFDIDFVLEQFADRRIASVLVEGGSKLANSFLTAGIIDKMFLFLAPKIIADNKAIPVFYSDAEQLIENTTQLNLISVEHLGDDLLVEYNLR